MTNLRKKPIQMIKHIVLFKMKEDIEAAELQSKLVAIRQALLNLKNEVPSLKSIEVGINCNPNEKFHLSLISTHDDMEGLKAYAVHPKHVAVSQDIRAILAERACNDFEF